MNSKTNLLKALNIIVTLSMTILSGYWAITLLKSSDLGENDKDIIAIFLAIAIIITAAIITVLLIYSTIELFKGSYKKQAQKVATILLIAFGVVGDLFVFRFFLELSLISKIIFVYFHVIIILHTIYSFKKISV
jgi:formate hydrogenlyase subunit 3/multisubunit Na+/H+ antiporter MnhD subunit